MIQRYEKCSKKRLLQTVKNGGGNGQTSISIRIADVLEMECNVKAYKMNFSSFGLEACYDSIKSAPTASEDEAKCYDDVFDLALARKEPVLISDSNGRVQPWLFKQSRAQYQNAGLRITGLIIVTSNPLRIQVAQKTIREIGSKIDWVVLLNSWNGSKVDWYEHPEANELEHRILGEGAGYAVVQVPGLPMHLASSLWECGQTPGKVAQMTREEAQKLGACGTWSQQINCHNYHESFATALRPAMHLLMPEM